MAITSYGYGDDTINEAEWARLAALAGSAYAYSSAGACAPYIASGLTLGFQDGSTFGYGVLDDFTSHTYTLPGQASWWCVVLRRSWGGLGRKSEIVALPVASVGVPGSRKAQPGSQDDQPLAIVQTSTSSILSVLDARQNASKTFFVRDIRVVHDPQLGASYTLPDGTVYDTFASGSGTTTLRKREVAVATAPTPTPTPTPDPTPTPALVPIRFGSQTSVLFDSRGSAIIRHNLGFRPSFFSVDWEVAENTTPLIIKPAYRAMYPDAVTSDTFRVFAKFVDNRPYPGQLSQLNWVAYGQQGA